MGLVGCINVTTFIFFFFFFSFFFLIGKQLLSYSFTNTTCSPNIYKINKNVVPGYCNRNYQIIKKKKKNYLPSNPSLSCKTPL